MNHQLQKTNQSIDFVASINFKSRTQKQKISPYTIPIQFSKTIIKYPQAFHALYNCSIKKQKRAILNNKNNENNFIHHYNSKWNSWLNITIYLTFILISYMHVLLCTIWRYNVNFIICIMNMNMNKKILVVAQLEIEILRTW